MRVTAAWIREQVVALMNETATIEKRTRVDQGSGKWTEDLSTVATSEPCRIAPLTSREIEIAMRRYGEVTHAGIFGPDLDIEPLYEVTDSQGRAFTVTEVVTPSIPGTFKKAIMYHRRPMP